MRKGIVGKYKDGYSYYFTTPREAVIVRLKTERRGQKMFTGRDIKINRDATWYSSECDRGYDGRMNRRTYEK